ncbi:hypothetical protein Acsp05_15370 [Actinokineospora sp. NBRC 105648]|nr:hypothetical protein Acsp05_15370 [Actinokineospora sp. NBRC 105648]
MPARLVVEFGEVRDGASSPQHPEVIDIRHFGTAVARDPHNTGDPVHPGLITNGVKRVGAYLAGGRQHRDPNPRVGMSIVDS